MDALDAYLSIECSSAKRISQYPSPNHKSPLAPYTLPSTECLQINISHNTQDSLCHLIVTLLYLYALVRNSLNGTYQPISQQSLCHFYFLF